MDRGKQIETGLVDFVPHPPSRLDAYAYLEEPMEMTFGKFHFRIEKEGSYRLEIPISSGLSAVDPDLSDSTSSTESGDEEISSARFISTRANEKLAKIYSDMSFESSADSYISDDSSNIDNFNFIDNPLLLERSSPISMMVSPNSTKFRIQNIIRSMKLENQADQSRRHQRLSTMRETHMLIPLISDEV
jgi:hypothetical protein